MQLHTTELVHLCCIYFDIFINMLIIVILDSVPHFNTVVILETWQHVKYKFYSKCEWLYTERYQSFQFNLYQQVINWTSVLPVLKKGWYRNYGPDTEVTVHYVELLMRLLLMNNGFIFQWKTEAEPEPTFKLQLYRSS